MLSKNNFFKYQAHFICISIILLYHLPYFVYGENAHLDWFDNLDSNIVWVKMLLDNHVNIFSTKATVSQVMQPLPASTFSSYYDASLIWFYWLGIYWGYVVNKLLLSIVAYFGMYLLLKKHVIPKNGSSFIYYSASLLFAIIPFWSFNMSVAALPLIFYAFLNIRLKKLQWHNWVILIVSTFFTSLLLSGIFVLLLFSLLFLYDFFRTKKLNSFSFLALLFNSIAYCISHFLILSTFFNPPFISHRTMFGTGDISLYKALAYAKDFFLYDTSFTMSLHFYFWPLVFLIILFTKKYRRVQKIGLVVSVYILLSAILNGLAMWSGFSAINTTVFKNIPIAYSRFIWLQPMCWYILLAISFYVISNRVVKGKLVIFTLVALQMIYMFGKHEVYQNLHFTTFKKYYDTNLFSSINKYINKPKNLYRVANLGIAPAVAQFNGFYTVDGYLVNYPLSYKLSFRKVMKNELNEYEPYKNFFDKGGSHCYLLKKENIFQFNVNKKIAKTIDSLNYDFTQLKRLDCAYLFSTSYINHIDTTILKYERAFETKDSYWKIYLYKLK